MSTTPLPMSTTPPEVVTAFRLFLGRAPNPNTPPQLGSGGVQALHRTLEKSREFRDSPRSIKKPYPWPLRQIMVSQPAKLVYCPIGKNACTFLKSEVARTARPPHIAHILKDIHFLTDHVRTGLQFSDYEPPEVNQMRQGPDYFRFAVLRDPMERLLSAYIEKFVMGRLQPANIHHTKSVVAPVQLAANRKKVDFDEGITFRAFIDYVTHAEAATLDPHWRPQALYLEGLRYDALFRIDQIGQLMEVLEERAGMKLGRQPRNVTGSGRGEDVANAQDLTPARIAAGPKLSKASFYDDAMRHAVETTFAADYVLLNAVQDTPL
ncbi:hypothetical protein GGQ68_004776 [Sagittula marina]|uniref:Sulfotransferase family protein n=1 Tax=Sagittula marina TaxID=943940 RepID=A0A7W6DTB1_9RHOB|nr:sulfotransferase family 2 domain-containing protein [Sagittula marina]MBB3988419.1 hypothetical protein [Sagittula marina]